MANTIDRNSPLLSAELAGGDPAPAYKGMTKARGFTEAQGFGNPVNGPFGFVEQQLGPLKTQVIEQCLVAATYIV